MNRSIAFLAVAGLLGVVLGAGSASAQCAFPQPSSAKKMALEFVQAYPQCTVPNDTNGNASMLTCSPPAAPSDWQWSASGRMQMKFTASEKNKVEDVILNPPGDTGDVGIQLKAQGLTDADGTTPLNAAGAIVHITARATCDERTNGDMTGVDFDAEFPINIAGGKALAKTSANVAINSAGIPGIPPCCNIEIVSVEVRDDADNPFARPGFLVPAL